MILKEKLPMQLENLTKHTISVQKQINKTNFHIFFKRHQRLFPNPDLKHSRKDISSNTTAP